MAGTFAELPSDEPYPGVVRRSFDGQGATVTRYEFAAGARFPLHHHPQEQILLVQEGTVDFTVDGEVHRLAPGSWSVVGGNVEHGLHAGDGGARFLAVLVPRRPSDAYTVSESGA